MNLLDDTPIDLPPTRTYKRREVTWYGKDADGFAGVIIRLWHGRRAWSEMVERDLYEVVEVEPDPGVMCRQFVFLNRTDPMQQLPYKVRIGRESSCTCKAGRCRTETGKHIDAVKAAMAEGIL